MKVGKVLTTEKSQGEPSITNHKFQITHKSNVWHLFAGSGNFEQTFISQNDLSVSLFIFFHPKTKTVHPLQAFRRQSFFSVTGQLPSGPDG